MDDALCTRIERCRICGSDRLEDVIDLGSQYIASLFPVGPLAPELDQPFPLHVVRCAEPGACGLVQLEHTVAPGILYDHYGYRSGTNEMMRANLAEIVHQIEEKVSLGRGDVVVDIGCNDGTLLKSYGTPGIERIGIDPSDAVKAIDSSEITVVNDFFSKGTFDLASPAKKARVVTSIAMFYDLDDPASFVKDVKSILSEDGIWVLELSYLPAMLEANAFDTICHEHLEYYSLEALGWLLTSEGLEIRAAQINDVNGGSIRAFVAHSGQRTPDEEREMKELLRAERELKLSTDAPFATFRHNCSSLKRDLTSLIQEAKAKGKRVYAYGASTKGNTLLQFCGLDSTTIEKAADRNPDKWGTTTIGTGIPIVSEEEARQDRPDFFLALPWHFYESFISREKDFLDSGGRFIFPLPELRIVGNDDI